MLQKAIDNDTTLVKMIQRNAEWMVTHDDFDDNGNFIAAAINEKGK
jgi:hypothetical protein